MFIDFLNLANKNFSKNKLTVFYGKSGSGKSTYLDFFMKNNLYKDYIFLFHKEKKIIFSSYKQKYIFIDEISTLYGLYVVFRFLLNGKKLFIATHIHPIIYKIFFSLFYKGNYFFTDKNNKKIEKILKNKGYIYDKNSIDNFVQKYKGNFVDLEIILDSYKNNKNFSQVLCMFEKESDIFYKNNIC